MYLQDLVEKGEVWVRKDCHRIQPLPASQNKTDGNVARLTYIVTDGKLQSSIFDNIEVSKYADSGLPVDRKASNVSSFRYVINFFTSG